MPHTEHHRRLTLKRIRDTGETHAQALLSMRKYGCRSESPIPSASTASQRRLEAVALYALVRGFRTTICVTRVSTLGIARVEPTPDSLTIQPHPGYLLRLLWQLLPSHDSTGLSGIPGLRPFRVKGCWELRLLQRQGVIRVRGNTSCSLDSLGGRSEALESDYVASEPLWCISPLRLTEIERQRLDLLDIPRSEALAALLSDLLRRPKVLVRIRRSGAHWVDLYDHSGRDLVVEWDCGPDEKSVATMFVESGLCVKLERGLGEFYCPESWDASRRFDFIGWDRPIGLLHHDYCDDCTAREAEYTRLEAEEWQGS